MAVEAVADRQELPARLVHYRRHIYRELRLRLPHSLRGQWTRLEHVPPMRMHSLLVPRPSPCARPDCACFDSHLQSSGASSLSGLRILRIMRTFRLIKLTRLLRASRIVQRASSRLAIPYSSLSLFSAVLGVAALAHWIACAWGAIGYAQARAALCGFSSPATTTPHSRPAPGP